MRPLIGEGPARLVLRAAHAADGIVTAFGRVGAWFTVPLVVLVVFDAVARRFVRDLPFVVDSGLYLYVNSPKIQDLEWHMHTVVFLLAIGYSYSRNMHVRLDMFRPRFGPRTRAAIELAGGCLLLVPFLLVLVRYGAEYWLSAWQSREISSSAIGLEHRWVIKAFVPLGFGLMLAIALSIVARSAVYLFGPASLRPACGIEAFTGDGRVRERATEGGDAI